jgi:hypothetical protein
MTVEPVEVRTERLLLCPFCEALSAGEGVYGLLREEWEQARGR